MRAEHPQPLEQENAVRDVVIVGAARTAIGTFGGGLKDFSATDLGTIAIQEALKRAGTKP